MPEKSAVRLLSKKEIQNEIQRIDKKRKQSEADISAGYFRLGFGCVSDAVKLIFSEDITEEKIDGLDLFNVSEIKRKKGGDVEIKFFDRLKALQQLYEMSERADSSEASIFDAIRKGASALKGDGLE